MTNDKLRILVLCTGNSCRSQMAEGFFRHYGRDCVDVVSAGTEPKGLNPIAVRVMNEIGIDISQHTSNHVRDYLDRQFDYVITVCDHAAQNCPRFPGEGTKLHWPFDDPADALTSRHCEPTPNAPIASHCEPQSKTRASQSADSNTADTSHSASENASLNEPEIDEEVLSAFRRIRDEIGAKVKNWLSS